MHIFDRKKKAIHTQLELIPRHEKEPYDIRAALSKALLVFMLSYGTVGGFLSAFSVEYNRVFAFVACLIFSLMMAFIYETKIKWFTNLSVILVFSIYAYVAVSRFWILNSGAYAIINRIYEVAQSYLGITEGGLYQLAVDDVTQAVSDIAVFVEKGAYLVAERGVLVHAEGVHRAVLLEGADGGDRRCLRHHAVGALLLGFEERGSADGAQGYVAFGGEQFDVAVFALDEASSLDGDAAHLVFVGQDLLLAVGGNEVDALLDGRDVDRAAREVAVMEGDDARFEFGHDEFHAVEQILLQVIASFVVDDAVILCK